MKKPLIFILSFILLAAHSFCINIDGKFWDWGKVRTIYWCPSRPLERDRSGLDMRSVKMLIKGKYLYIYIDGRSVTGFRADSGWGAKKTSIRISFTSSQSPLNRIRIATDPSRPGKIKISWPAAKSRTYGSKADRYWAIAKYGAGYAFEVKIPIVASYKGIHVCALGRPLIWVPPGSSLRKHLSEVLINTVDMKTHRLVDTIQFPVRKGSL